MTAVCRCGVTATNIVERVIWVHRSSGASSNMGSPTTWSTSEVFVPLPRLPAEVVESRLAEWRRMLRNNPTQGRQVLRRVLKGRIRFTPRADGYEFECPTRFDRLFAEIVAPRPASVPGGDLRGTGHIRPGDTLDVDYERALERAEDPGGRKI
jgi:hypothetical protein